MIVAEAYQHALSKKKTSEAFTGGEKMLPIDSLGLVMIQHGEEYSQESPFGASHFPQVIRATAYAGACYLTFRECVDQIWAGPLQDCDTAGSVCVDLQGYVHKILEQVQGRNQGTRIAEEEA